MSTDLDDLTKKLDEVSLKDENTNSVIIQKNVRKYLKHIWFCLIINSIIIIQKNVRGYLCRNIKNNEWKHIKEWKVVRNKYKGLDIIPKDLLRKLYQTYRFKMINYHKIEICIEKYLGRIEQFPDYISENIVLYALKNNKIECTWKTKSGDIHYFNEENKLKKGEVKCAQNGPTQFSPSSEWDTLFYIDAHDHLYGNIKIYMITDIYNIIKKIKVSKTQTIEEQSNEGRRPRFNLNTLLDDYIIPNNILFDGKISSLLY
tara:strand:- start:194 stop:970 length:777 start_codon:yes stop_codon:yes gene_type:complete